MKRPHYQRSPAEISPSAARTTWLLNRVRVVATFARRSGHRKGNAAVGAVGAIKQQLRTLQPICSAQRVSNGSTCGAPAVAVAEIHAIGGCNQIGLSPEGDLVEMLCQACLATLQRAMTCYVGDKRETASQCGTHPACSTCGRPSRSLGSVFAVRPIGPEGLA